MRRLPMVLVAVLLASCSPRGSGSLGPAPTGSPPPPPASPAVSAPAATSAQPKIAIQVWFERNGRLVPTRRSLPATPATSRLALTQLMAGPSTVEAQAGVGSAVAPQTPFDIKGISHGTETVSFPAAFFAGDAARVTLRKAQVVYSLTQFPSVTRVAFQSGGVPAGGPLGRADLAGQLPRVVVTSPFIGQETGAPIQVTGTADARESTVNVRVLDAGGAEIATRFATATCGNGCRGDYAVSVPIARCPATPARVTVEAFWLSGEDGSRRDTFAVPITLTGCQGTGAGLG